MTTRTRGRRWASLAAAAVVTATAGLIAAPTGAEQTPGLYGLVIGIDAYQAVEPLEGAVNDATDLAASLRKAGAREVRLLTDRQASRNVILDSWAELVAKAPPGSLMVLSYAGRGARSPELVKGSEADGLDEAWVLGDFSPRGPGVHQRILDDDVAAMLQKASPLTVLVVSDSCQSGTLSRSLDRRNRPGTRGLHLPPLDPDPLLVPDEAAARPEPAELPNVVFFAAAPDESDVPEVVIDQHKRGALSWAVARALEGQADRNGDGRTSPEELERFVRETVRMKVEGLQTPQVTRGSGTGALVLPTGLPRPPAGDAPNLSLKDREPISLAVVNSGSIPAKTLLGALTGIAPADKLATGRFAWDVGQGWVLSGNGDLIAALQPGPAEAQRPLVQAILDTWRVLAVLERDAQRRSLQLRLDPGDRQYRAGEPAAFVIAGLDEPHLTLFTLSADGTVNFLYPLRGNGFDDPLTVPKDQPIELPVEAAPPFGAEHVVAIASAAPLPGLHQALIAIDGDRAAAQVPELMAKHLAGVSYQLGVHGLFTAP